MKDNITGYHYSGGQLNDSHRYLRPSLMNILEGLHLSKAQQHVFELGCGNGPVVNFLVEKGWEVIGVDPSTEGIAQANHNYPHLKLLHGSASDDLPVRFGHCRLYSAWKWWNMTMPQEKRQRRSSGCVMEERWSLSQRRAMVIGKILPW